MSIKLNFTLHIESDYHISAGHGLGAGVDSALQRDGDGVPVIRGTVLSGILRDGLWRLLHTVPMKKRAKKCKASGASDEHDPSYCGQFHANGRVLCPVCSLFGTPREPKRWHIQSARPKEQLKIASGSFQSHRQVVQRVGISPRTRRADPRKLFSQEDGHGESEFVFSITCLDKDPSTLDEAALWLAAARNVRRLGRSRNRGQGECLFKLTGVEGLRVEESVMKDGQIDWQATLLRHFQKVWLEGKPTPRQSGAQSFKAPELKGEQPPVRVRMIVRADEPLLIARRAEAGNQFESQPYISGQTVRGALAWLAASRFDLKKDTQAKEAFTRVFLRAMVHFPMLYPAKFKGNLRPAIPAPRDLFTCKAAPGTKGKSKDQRGYGHGIWFASENKLPPDCPTCHNPLQEVKGFVLLREDHWADNDFCFKATRSNEMHIQIEPEKGRVEQGALFGYVVLDAGQYFVGDMYFSSQSDWDTFQALTGIGIHSVKSQVLRLGKASRRGYGQVTVWLEVLSDPDEDTWRRKPLEKRLGENAAEIRLTLLTDTIVQDAWGRYATGFISDWLKRETNLDIVEILPGTVAATILVDGFNSQHCLPRWRDVSLAAGSTVKLRLSTAVKLERLRELECDGIGLRRGEGFGQIAFNHPVYEHCNGIARGIDIDDEALGLASYHDSVAKFQEQWNRELDKQEWDQCKNPRFTTVARWLLVYQDEQPASLVTKLDQLGEPSPDLKRFIPDYGNRHKDSKLQEYKDGLKIVKGLLNQLQQRPQDRAFWPLGISMLADRIDMAVDKDKER